MLLFYTGASSPKEKQQAPHKSLGGFVSSTLVFNGQENLFPKTKLGDPKSIQYRLIALVNTLSTPYTSTLNLTLNPFSNTSKTRFRVAIVQPSINNCGEESYEKILSPKHRPQVGTFSSYIDINTPTLSLSLPQLATDSSLGIWIERESIGVEVNDSDSYICDSLKDTNGDIVLPDPGIESLNISIDY